MPPSLYFSYQNFPRLANHDPAAKIVLTFLDSRFFEMKGLFRVQSTLLRPVLVLSRECSCSFLFSKLSCERSGYIYPLISLHSLTQNNNFLQLYLLSKFNYTVFQLYSTSTILYFSLYNQPNSRITIRSKNYIHIIRRCRNYKLSTSSRRRSISPRSSRTQAGSN